MMKKLFFFVLSMALWWVASGQEVKLTANDGEAGDFFGAVVRIYDGNAVLSALEDDDIGSAYVFKKIDNTWVQEAKLMPSDGAPGDWFGVSAFNNNWMIGGATRDDDNGMDSGSAYLFKRTGDSWTQETKLTPSDGATGDFFGTTSNIEGDYLIIGAMWDDDNGMNSGSAYVFKQSGNTWVQDAKLKPSDGSAGAWFGHNSAIYGDYAVVNAPFDNNNQGAVYIFKKTGETWTQEAKLSASDGIPGDGFGVYLGIYGDYLLVGAYENEGNGTGCGSVYVFKRLGDTWIQEAKLVPPDGQAGDQFGNSLALFGNYVVIGAERTDDNGEDSGAAYVFKRTGDTWEQITKLTPSDGAAGDRYGHSVAIYGDDIMVGAFGNEQLKGAVYCYSLADILASVAIERVAVHSHLLTLFPNPAGETVRLTHAEGKLPDQVALYDQSGRLLRLMTLRHNVLDVSGLPAGVYYVGVQLEDGTAMKKLVVAR